MSPTHNSFAPTGKQERDYCFFENKKATKAETKPTYDQIKEYVMDKYGVKVSSLDIANAKNEFELKERENYNLPKSENSRRPNLTPKKKEMIKEAFQDFNMI